MYTLYKSVFGSIVLSNQIFKYSRLYKKNEFMEFDDREMLVEYPEKEYIKHLIYSGEELLKKGDLPEYGVLQSINIESYGLNVYLESSDVGIIPYGVEMIECNEIEMRMLKLFPKTVNTVKNIIINSSNDIYIPSNITSIYFKVTNTPELNLKQFESIKTLSIFNSINYGGNMDIQLPQSLTKLELLNIPNKFSSNIIPNTILSLVLNEIDIVDRLPQCLTYLKLYETPMHCYTAEESLKLISILPQTLTKLTVPDSFETFKFIYPSNIKTIKFR